MITAFGAGIGEDFDPAKARYHKIVLMADADVDGQHITTLLLTLLFRYMRPLIDMGYVYLAQPPLYRIKWTNAEHEYVFSDAERDASLAAGAEAGRRLAKESGVQRYKGLGEMNAEQLWETTLNPDTRRLLPVQVDTMPLQETEHLMTRLMGKGEAASRRELMELHGDAVDVDI